MLLTGSALAGDMFLLELAGTAPGLLQEAASPIPSYQNPIMLTQCITTESKQGLEKTSCSLLTGISCEMWKQIALS